MEYNSDLRIMNSRRFTEAAQAIVPSGGFGGADGRELHGVVESLFIVAFLERK